MTGVPETFTATSVMEFDHDFKLSGTWDDKKTNIGELELKGEHVGAFVQFATTGKVKL